MEEPWSQCGVAGARQLGISGCGSQLCLCCLVPRVTGNLYFLLPLLWTWDSPHGLCVLKFKDGASVEGK